MDRYLLLMSWRGRQGEAGSEGPSSGLMASSICDLLKTSCNAPLNRKVEEFPACSLAGVPGLKEWYFAIQSICGFYQFCSSDWEDICFDLRTDESKDMIQKNIEAYLGDIQTIEEEDGNSRELSLIDLYEESAEGIHQLADKLPAPGRAMVDVILQSSEREAPRLKDCLPVIGALKHLREWHTAKITIVANENKTWQKVADYLCADIVAPKDLKNSIDSRELWRGKIQIWERKFGSEITFPDFCIKGTASRTPFSVLHLNTCFAAEKTEQTKNTNFHLPKVFHYYGSALKFVQIVLLSDLPSSLVSDIQFEVSLARTNVEEKSMLFWNQISSLCGKVGALFVLPCSVSGMLIPLPSQLSTKKWKEYMAQKPKVINAPEAELKGETCNYYFLVQGNGCKGCKATLIYSASQINGSVTLAETVGKLTTKAEDTEAGLFEEVLRSLPHFYGEQILQREKNLACIQALALNQFLRGWESARQPLTVSPDKLKELLTCTRERFLQLWNTKLPTNHFSERAVKTEGHGTICDLMLKNSNPLEWPERNVFQNLENFEKIKQKTRVSEQLLGHKDGQKESATLLDAKELLKYFTPEGLPIGDLQPLCFQKSENAFLLTPELTPRKLKSLPFEKAAGCHYHGLEYCLDNRGALERDVVLAELQTRLIRYETQTTCTKQCCPVPSILSPLPSPAVLSEPGSIPDGETLQRELLSEASRLKRRSKDLDGFYPNKRLMKSESSDSLVSQASGSSSGRHSGTVSRKQLETSASLSSVAVKQAHNRLQKTVTKSSLASQKCVKEPEISKPAKEPRSQKHTRMLKEVVTKTLEKHGIAEDHKCFVTCSQRLFEIAKFYLKVIEWVLEKTKQK
ncbi:mdm2-binding protein isoform X2 [Hemicordylus capensis]|uniref:mdm2-binding protein isoform X2 n=1 Tax=Hemicordylus capensis TaxID=884348 RepID=UPI00230382EE|nr:mdm2-binding protein isoform X2 [Hemicordylus capensis]